MPEAVNTRSAKPFDRRAEVVVNSFDAAENTVEIVFATEAPVLRNTWEGKYFEILRCVGSSVRMDRLNNGGPVVDTHGTYSITNQLGVVVKAWVDQKTKECRAIVKLSQREEWKGVADDIKAGIIRNISVGYRIYKVEVDDSSDNETPNYNVTDWEPYEISFCPMPADYMAGTRSGNVTENEVTIISKNSNQNNMPKNAEGAQGNEPETRTEPAATPAPAATVDTAERSAEPAATQLDENQVRASERKRIADIRTTARIAGVTDEAFVNNLIDKGTATDEARAAIINKAAASETAQPSPQSGSRIVADEADKIRGGAEIFLMQRSGIAIAKETKPEHLEFAKQFRGMTLLDIAKDSLKRAGVDYRGMDKMEIVGRAFTSSSSDFPVLLEGTTRRILLAAYGIQADSWKEFCMVGSVSDFRTHKRLRMGSFSKLDAVNENGEYKTKAITDAESESISASTFGNVINVSRKMVINDDLQGFTRLAQMLGRAAARSIEIDVFTLLASNPTMGDGVALFHADHNNVGTGGAMSVTTFDELRVKMASQKDKDNNDYLDLRPSVLLCGVGYGGGARVLNQAQYDPSVSNKFQVPNKVAGLFGKIVDTPRITDTKYYAFADPNVEPVIEVAFLDGNQTPFMESRNGFEVDGVEWKIRHDYGVGAIGWRGAVYNAGV
jgi:hypothetical protein